MRGSGQEPAQAQNEKQPLRDKCNRHTLNPIR